MVLLLFLINGSFVVLSSVVVVRVTLLLLFEAMVLLLFVVMVLLFHCANPAVVRDMVMLFGTMVWLSFGELVFLYSGYGNVAISDDDSFVV